MKNTITEMKNTLEVISSRVDEVEDWVSNLEGKIAENTQQKEKRIKKWKSLRDFWDNMKCNNICTNVEDSEGSRTYLEK